MTKVSYQERLANTQQYLKVTGNNKLFETVRKDGKAAKVSWFARKPCDYDSKTCLPWGDVRGRYWEI